MTSTKKTGEVNRPLVSVLVACYNQARYVEECLDSVLNQTYENIELIIIDDCSQDDSASVIQRWLVTNNFTATFFRHQQNQGICKTFNAALQRATGEYVCVLAADDVYLPEKIECQVRIMENLPPKVGVVYSDSWQMDVDGNPLAEKFIEAHRQFQVMPEGNLFSVLLRGNFIPAMATMIRRECFATVGPYDEELVYEDFDMWLRIARHYDFAFSATISAKYRIVPESMTRVLRKGTTALKSEFRIFEKLIRSNEFTEDERRHVKARLASIAFHMYENNCAGRTRYLRKVFRYYPCKYTLAMLLLASSRVPFGYFKRILPRPPRRSNPEFH
ncbi:MAG TPA: glycosyltransferase [Pyrinomonadaceae bacterium]|nr:glycosyltransferase [Pyrinomonadaceae bacterium]